MFVSTVQNVGIKTIPAGTLTAYTSATSRLRSKIPKEIRGSKKGHDTFDPPAADEPWRHQLQFHAINFNLHHFAHELVETALAHLTIEII